MTEILNRISAFFMSAVTWFLGIFGANLYNNGFGDIDFSTVKSISFSSELVLEDLHGGSATVLQGGCTDGKYAYFCTTDGYADVCSISKYEIKTWKEVKRSNSVKVDHGNDITYNSDKRCLVVCHNEPNRTLVSFVNRKTLAVIETFEIPLQIYSITYNAKTNQYAVGISYSFDFAILDKNFNVIKTIKGVKPESKTRQGMDSDDKYIYFLLSSPNAISVYDWNGNHYGVYKLNDTAVNYESENIFLYNDSIYIGYNYGFGRVYKTNFEVQY